jgi:anti-sigma B factor antagonist
MNMNVTEIADGITHVVLDGRLDIAGAQQIDLTFAALSNSKDKLIVDLGKVDFIASMGVRTLMFGGKTIARKGGRIVICNPEENVEKVLRMTGLDEVVAIYPDYASALAALSA